MKKALSTHAIKKNDRIRQLAIFMIENPTLNRHELAEKLDLNYFTVCRMIKDNYLLKAIKSESSKDMVAMLPLAMKGFRDSLTTGNEKIKYFASKDLLQSEKILGPERIDVTINENNSKTIEELQSLIKEAQSIPAPTIDAEVIS